MLTVEDFKLEMGETEPMQSTSYGVYLALLSVRTFGSLWELQDIKQFKTLWLREMIYTGQLIQ